MLLIIFREIVVLILSLAVFPAIVLVLLSYSDSVETGMALLSRKLFSGGIGPWGTSLELWFRLITPYGIVQSIRAFRWSQRNEVGRRWANLYFSLVLGLLGTHAAWPPAELFSLMYAMGDVPAELVQLVEIEGINLLIALFSFSLALYCFTVFLNPERKIRTRSTT
jgi:hypothetical protein